MSGKILTGARALVYLAIPGQPKLLVGIFTSASYSLGYSAPEAYVLGAYAPVETTYTDQQPVMIQCGGWRVMNFGPHVQAAVPKLQDLLRHEYLDFEILDRKTNELSVRVQRCRPLGYNTGFTARAQSEIGVQYVGLTVSDEAGTHAESAGANPFV